MELVSLLGGAHHVHIFELACVAWDRCEEARRALAKHGSIFTEDRGNPRPRPEIAIEKDSRIAFARLIRELDLDVEAPAINRFGPPALASNRG